ncbi:hypothetical protein PF004_g24945 [Phytophthora fragariae]|uniref:Transmembrane protein 198 n=2 Tax=Phytophthora fragariae TaxID=53985 RepID=A0A6G0MSQ2_9STRA|nr:hypothetical protein PF003_g10818 [Phytophthora fragariae]KAE9180079.1 hypothetical protein PF004_g24945 [Phytophthora fragariae]
MAFKIAKEYLPRKANSSVELMERSPLLTKQQSGCDPLSVTGPVPTKWSVLRKVWQLEVLILAVFLERLSEREVFVRLETLDESFSDGIVGDISNTIQVGPSIAAVIAIVCGAVMSTCGYKLLRLTMFARGFLVGGYIVSSIVQYVSARPSGSRSSRAASSWARSWTPSTTPASS